MLMNGLVTIPLTGIWLSILMEKSNFPTVIPCTTSRMSTGLFTIITDEEMQYIRHIL